MRVFAGVAVAVLLIVASAFIIAPTGTDDFDQEQIEAEVLKVMETFMDGFRELDMEKVIQTAHTDALMFHYGGRVLDFAGYRDAIESWADGKTSWKGGWTETHVRVLSPDLAAASGIYVDTIQFADGRHLHWPTNASAFLFERTPDGWKWSVGSNSSPTGQPVGEG